MPALSGILHFQKGSGQIDVLGDVIIAALPVSQVRPSKARRDLHNIAGAETVFRNALVIIEHHVEFRLPYHLQMQTSIAVRLKGVLHHTGSEGQFFSVHPGGISHGPVPVQHKNRQAQRGSQKAEKCPENGISLFPEKEAWYGERRKAQSNGQQHRPGQDIIRKEDRRRA